MVSQTSLPPAAAPAAITVALPDVARHASAFLEHARFVRQVSPYTIRWYREALANLMRYLNEANIATLPHTGAALDDWVAWNAKRELARPTVNSYWRGVRPFFTYLQKRLGAANPYVDATKPESAREDERVRDALVPDQLAAIFDAAEHYPWKSDLERTRAVALVGIMIYAGLRKGEVLRLMFGQVNLDTRTILVSRGKGRRGGKDRTVHLPLSLCAILGEYRAARASHVLRLRGEVQVGFTCAAFFVSSRQNRGLSDVQFRRVIAAIRRASPVPFFPHLLRHSYITMLMTERVALHDIQYLAGHSDLKTTSLYLHPNDERMRAAVADLDVRCRPRA